MPLKDFRVVNNIGKGSFASVYKVIRKSDNKVYALKKVKINKMSKKEIADALNEIRFLASIRQKNIVGFLEAFTENNESELCIVMEYCGCGDLAQKVERYKRRKTYIDEDVIWRYLIQGLKALSYLHERGICHRDIKTANCFLAEDGSVKMGDMNVSKRMKKGHLQTQIGTPYYMSPEIWNNRPYDFSSDIWSLGCMIYELCALKPPFTGTDFPSLKRAINTGRYSSIPKKFTENLSKVIGKMLRLNPKERPTADHLLRSNELAAKLQLDEGKMAGVSYCSAEEQRQQLLRTILVPQNLRQLNNALPKPCYPKAAPKESNKDDSKNAAAAAAPPAVNDKNLPPAPPPPANGRAPLAPVSDSDNVPSRKEQQRKDREAVHKEEARGQMYKDYAPNPPKASHQPVKPSPSQANLGGVPYNARPGRLNMAQYNAAVQRQQAAVNNVAPANPSYYQGGGVGGMAPAGIHSRANHHRIW